MPTQTLKDVGIWIDGYDFSGVSNSVTGPELSKDTPEDTVFRPAGGYRTFNANGLKSAAFSAEGFFNTALSNDAEHFDSLANEKSVMLVPAGFTAGDVAYVVPVTVSAHSLGGSIGDLLGFSYAAASNGRVYRASVFDVRDNVTVSTITNRVQLGAIPDEQTLRLWLHLDRVSTAGTIRIDIRSAPAQSGVSMIRGTANGMSETGLYLIEVDGPQTDEWWEVEYTPVGGADFDVASATFFDSQQAPAVPITPVTPPTPTTHTFLGGLSADAIPETSELTINPAMATPADIRFGPFTNMHVLIAREDSQPDITSLVLASDPTNLNQIAAFSKYVGIVDVGGTDYKVWVSNQELTFAGADTFEAR